jgi:hypothetical protein
MSGGLLGSAADWIAIWRARIAELGWTHSEVDFRAQCDARADGERWGDGYCSKLLCGDREPTATTISRMNRALRLNIRIEVEVDPALTPP